MRVASTVTGNLISIASWTSNLARNLPLNCTSHLCEESLVVTFVTVYFSALAPHPLSGIENCYHGLKSWPGSKSNHTGQESERTGMMGGLARFFSLTIHSVCIEISNQWPLVCLGSYCNDSNFHKRNYGAFTKKRACTCLLQTSSNHVAPIKTSIECLYYPSRFQTWQSPFQVTSLIFPPCYSHQLPGICGIGHIQLLPHTVTISDSDLLYTSHI